jgi:MFS family permease
LEYAFIGGLSISQALLVSPLTAYTNTHYGLKATLLIGLALQTTALICASFATQVWHLFLTQGLCFGWGMGFLYVGSAAVVPRWFSTRRSLATGITSAGAGFGGLAYNLATNSLIEEIGLNWTLRALALCQIVVNAICIVLLKERPTVVKPSGLAFDWKHFRRGPIWLILGWGFFSELGYVVLLYSMPDYAVSVGLSSSQGAIIGAMLSLGLGVGRPMVGWVSDEFGRINIASIMTALSGAFCLLIWVFAKQFGVLCFFAFIVGMVCGTYWSTVVPVIGEIVDMKDLSGALSIAFMGMMFPTTCKFPKLVRAFPAK